MKKNVNPALRLLATVMTVLTLIYALPLGALAAYVDSGESAATSNAAPEASVPSVEHLTDGVVYELTSLRDEYSKHFRLTDGSNIAVSYSDAVHYLDGGEWRQIDNTLELRGSTYVAENEHTFFFPASSSAGYLAGVTDGHHRLRFSAASGSGTAPLLTARPAKVAAPEPVSSPLEVGGTRSSVRFDGLLNGIDYEYVLSGNTLYENIVLASPASIQESFAFLVYTDHLTASLAADGAVDFLDSASGKLVYRIPRSYMEDAVGAYSGEVSYGLVPLGAGTYRLTIVPDTTWLSSSARVYPVVIDPPITVGSGITDAYVRESYPDLGYNSVSFSVGISSSGRNVAFVRAPLPTLPNGSVVTNASLILNLSSAYVPDGGYGYIGISRATSSWSDSAITWTTAHPNGGAIYETTPEDYIRVASTNNGAREFDVTCSTKAMLEDGVANYGYALYPLDQSSFFSSTFYSTASSTTSAHPSFTLRYMSTLGLDDRYSYSSHSARAAGTGYIGDANGQLTLELPLLTTSEELLSYPISLVYNGQHAGSSVDSLTGYGFHFSFVERIEQRSVGGLTYYVYIDSDGTEHALLYDSATGKYRDEDGLDLSMVPEYYDGNFERYRLTASDGSYKFFRASGKLSRIYDSFGNFIEFYMYGYSSDKTYIDPYSGSNQNLITFTYNSTGTLASMTDPIKGVTVLFGYSTNPSGTIANGTSGYLKSVTFAEAGNTSNVFDRAYYEYDSAGRLKYATDSYGNYYIEYTYDSTGRVTAVTEYGYDEATAYYTVGGKVGYTYHDSDTVMRAAGADDVYGNADDILTHITFDYASRTVSTYSTDLTGKIFYGANTVGYEEAIEAARNKINMSLSYSSLPVNYLRNGSFEQGKTGWTLEGNMMRDTDASRNNVKNGYHMLYYLGWGADAIGTATQTVTLDRGTYTFSVFMRMESSNMNIFDCDADIKLIVRDASGTVVAESAAQTMASERLVDWTEFQRISTTFTVTSDNTVYSLVIHVEDTTDDHDSVAIDDAALTGGNGADNYSFVSNGDFELGATDWSGGTVVSGALSGTSALALTGSPLTEAKAVQTVYEMTDSGLLDLINTDYYSLYYEPEYYIFSAWAKANAVPNRDGRFFGVRVEISYAYAVNGVTGISVEVPFRTDTEEWQLVSAGIRTHAKAIISAITVTLVYDHQLGTAVFDRINLFRDSSALTIIEYNESGYAEIVETSDGGKTEYFYNLNDASKVTSEIYTKGDVEQTTTYTYNSTSNPQYVTGASVTMGGQTVNESTNRNVNGQITGVTVTGTTAGSTAGEQAYGKTTYSMAEGQLGKPLTYTDADNQTTRYFYNANGRLEYLIDPTGNGLHYTYNKDGSLAKVQAASYNATSGAFYAGAGEVSYTYNDAGLLSQLETYSTVYTFSYDGYGNLASVKIGDTTLVSYSYAANNGKMTSMTYGGKTLSYEYDDLGRISYIRYGGMLGTSYAYNHAGQLTEVLDRDALLRHGYVYDNEGKITNYTLDDVTLKTDGSLSTATLRYSIFYTYDDAGRLLSRVYGFSEAAGLQLSKYNYYYNDAGQLDRYHYGFHSPMPATLEYTYTPGGSPESETLNMGGSNAYVRAYRYQQYTVDSVTYTGSRVATYTETIAGVTTTWYYTYDGRGNITRIERQPAGETRTVAYVYTYDDIGNLMQADDYLLGNTYYYSYDASGNIYNQLMELSSGGSHYWVYYYSMDVWGDLLTSFDGTAITYDAYGKPLSWKGYTMSWNAANRLASVTASGKAYSYTYDVDGLRLTASDGTTKRIYTYDGTRLIREELRSVSTNATTAYIYYYYDASGTPYGFFYRTADQSYYENFYYRRNLQGDIVGILNSSGVQLATYTYSPYGMLVNTSYDASLTANARTAIDASSLRYKGYYYDSGTGFYYLQSRYYDPQVGRFISPDSYVSTGQGFAGNNMFAYCNNNPINSCDPMGTSAVGTWMASMWWLHGIDGPLPIGDVIFWSVTAIVAIGSIIYKSSSDTSSPSTEDSNQSKNGGSSSDKSTKSRLTGEPGEVKREGNNETHIGSDGRADKERHWTDHSTPKYHSNPHDHNISWDENGNPVFGRPQNYWGKSIPLFP